MHLTPELVEKLGGERSFTVRAARRQAGNKILVEALEKVLVFHIGACRTTMEDIKAEGREIFKRKYSFSGTPVVFTPMDDESFDKHEKIGSVLALRLAMLEDGVIGLRSENLARKEDKQDESGD